jgi:hypothetical protein
MAKAFAFSIKLNQNQPTILVTDQVKGIEFALMTNEEKEHEGYYLTEWKKKVEFTLIIDKLTENTVKEYKGYYWWNSKGEENIEWVKNSENPDFEDPEKIDPERIMKTFIMEGIASKLGRMAMKNQTHILWKIPFKKNIKVGVWLNLKKEENLPSKGKLITVPITLYLENQKFEGEYQVETKEENVVADYNFEWKSADQEEAIYNLNFYSDYQEDVKNLLNDLLGVEEIYDLENTTQEEE